MKIDLNAKLVDHRGRTIKEGPGTDAHECEFGETVEHAYLNPPANIFSGMGREEKLRRDRIVKALAAGGIQEFKEAEVEEMRTVTAHYPIAVVGAIERVLKAASETA